MAKQAGLLVVLGTCTLGVLGVQGCATEKPHHPSRDLAEAVSGEICKNQHTEGNLIVCDQLFSAMPLIDPPADDVLNADAVTLYAGISYFVSNNQAIQVIDRNGRAYSVVDKSGKAVLDIAKLPKNLQMPSSSVLITIYKVTGKIKVGNPEQTEVTDPSDGTKSYETTSTIFIDTVTPAIQISGCAMDSAMLGSWEGSSDNYGNASVPFTVTFDKLTKENNLTTFQDKKKALPDAEVYGLIGNVTNGKVDANNPFTNAAASSSIEIYRIAKMHDSPLEDSHIVIKFPVGMPGYPPGADGMSYVDQLGPFSPAALIQTQMPKSGTPLEDMFNLDFTQHGGYPPHILHAHLHPVKWGSSAAAQCTSLIAQ